MTSYVFAVTNTPSSVDIGDTLSSQIYTLAPGSFEIKITQVDYGVVSVAASDTQITPHVGYAPTIYRYASGTASGGTTATPMALRQGSASPSTATRWGTGVSVSGTQTLLYSPLPVTATNSANSSKSYVFPSDLIVSPGGVLSFVTGGMGTGGSGGIGATITATIQVIVYFEELRLAWHT